MGESILKLAIAASLPAVAAALLHLLETKTPFGKVKYVYRQILYGLVFGAIAIVGNEWGIPVPGAKANCRDAAVLVGGLFFGSPAGIIAGFIGGIERWLAAARVGTFTKVACTVSTIIAGFYAAALRKFMFENRRPGGLISLAIGVVMEVFHLTMVFITNIATPIQAMDVVKACTVPMVVANGLSVFVSALVLKLLSGGFTRKGKTVPSISYTVQKWLLVTVLLAFFTTSGFVYSLQDKLSSSQTDSMLAQALDETVADIRDASDANLIRTAREIESALKSGESIASAAERFGVAEISVIDSNGIIVRSNVPSYVSLNMRTIGAQAADFLNHFSSPSTRQYIQEYGAISSDPNVKRKYAGIRSDSAILQAGLDEEQRANGVILQVGLDADMFQDDIGASVRDITKNRHVGSTGYILILDEQMNIVSGPEGLTQTEVSEAVASAEIPPTDTTLRATIEGVDVFYRYGNTEGYHLISVYPTEEALQIRNIALYVNTFMEILVFAILFALVYLLIKKVIVNRMKRVNTSLGRITAGDLDEVVDVRQNEEFNSLSDDINSTVNTLKQYIDEANKRIDQELEVAKNIQASALPNVFPAFPKRKDFDIYATMRPAREVGGDFYDFYMTGDNRLHFLIADVSGKGIPAAMFMMQAKAELKSLTETDLPIGDVFTRGNDALCEGNNEGMFVTAWQGSLDLDTGHTDFVSAGHNPPLIRRGDGSFEYLRSRIGLVLAGMSGVPYKAQDLELKPGDTLFLYTDGVTEAQNAEKELFGEARLKHVLSNCKNTDMKGLCEAVRDAIDEFVGDAPQFDDITMVALNYTGKPTVPTVHTDNATLNDINRVTSFVEGELEKMDCPMKAVVQINVAIDEIYSNIVLYAYRDGEGSGPVTVELIANEDPHGVSVRFIDEGMPYNPLTKEDPDVTLSAEERGIGGLGIYMVKKTMDAMHYEYTDGKNMLTITKNF